MLGLVHSPAIPCFVTTWIRSASRKRPARAKSALSFRSCRIERTVRSLRSSRSTMLGHWNRQEANDEQEESPMKINSELEEHLTAFLNRALLPQLLQLPQLEEMLAQL